MTRIFLAATLLSLSSACVIVDEDPPAPPPNYAPYIDWADAGCYWDDYNGDFIWYFQGDVFDDNGVGDVESVWADVYDARGTLVETFRLFNEGGSFWFSDWLQYSTYLDCYYGGYQVDIVAYDWAEAYDVVTVLPATYAR